MTIEKMLVWIFYDTDNHYKQIKYSDLNCIDKNKLEEWIKTHPEPYHANFKDWKDYLDIHNDEAFVLDIANDACYQFIAWLEHLLHHFLVEKEDKVDTRSSDQLLNLLQTGLRTELDHTVYNLVKKEMSLLDHKDFTKTLISIHDHNLLSELNHDQFYKETKIDINNLIGSKYTQLWKFMVDDLNLPWNTGDPLMLEDKNIRSICWFGILYTIEMFAHYLNLEPFNFLFI